MNAYVAVTDPDWFRFLASQDGIDEVNFWQPKPWGGRFGVLERGQPLLFKLKSPHNAIAGGGFFEHYTELPISLAWEAFGRKNGAASFEEVRDRTARLRRDRLDPWEDYSIGCILLVEPFFWPESDWIPQPDDWGRNIVRGKGYDLRTGAGKRLWSQVEERLGPWRQLRRAAESPDDIAGGYGAPSLVPRRLGQGTFRIVVTDAYERRCAVTRERALPTLDAAHIKPFSDVTTHSVRNGLLLRSDVHRLFDRGYITVTPAHRVEASRRMKEDFNDGDNYLKLHGASIALPADPSRRPEAEFLRWHNENAYRG